MTTGSLDQFLDCLDFAPSVVKDMIKDLAVELERLKKLYRMKDEYLYLEDMEDIDKIEKL